MSKYLFTLFFLAVMASVCPANSPPTVTDVNASPRADGSGIVDVYYTLSDDDDDSCMITVMISDDGGITWMITPSNDALSGDVGTYIKPGQRHIVWASQTDLPKTYGTQYRVKVNADDVTDVEFVDIDDPGIPGYEGFYGQMSKYETTYAQYSKYLDTALADGLIVVDSNIVYATSDNSREQPYMKTYAASSNNQIVYSEGTFSVRNRDGHSMVNHPVVMVSWYGAKAFCEYRGYRLPTEWEWQAVADFNGSYIYGCGTEIDSSKANFLFSNPLELPFPYSSPVGYYPVCGYGMYDMAGNVWEWTSSDGTFGSSRIIRGGSWYSTEDTCTVLYRNSYYLDEMSCDIGFRVCRQ